MKKMVVTAIAVLFLSFGLCYASSTEIYDYEGPMSSLILKITYVQDLPATSTLTDGRALLQVTSGLNEVSNKVSVYEPQVYLDFTSSNFTTSSPGMLSKILISWLGPNVNDIANGYYTLGERILTIACSGGNNSISNPNPDLGATGISDPTDGTISTKPQIPTKNPPATKTSSIEGVAACHICPSGIQFSSGKETGFCNDGSSYVDGYITYQGTGTKNNTLGYVTSASFTFTVAAGGFSYVGEDWAVDLNAKGISGKQCNITCENSTSTGTVSCCPAILTGAFKATLAPCNTDSTWQDCISGVPTD